MVDPDDTRRTMDDGRRTTPGVWHKLPTGELKTFDVGDLKVMQAVPKKQIINFFWLYSTIIPKNSNIVLI